MLLTMKFTSDPTEKRVCKMAMELAQLIALRVQDVRMLDIELPLGYVAKWVENQKAFRLFKISADKQEWPINIDDPVVELCLNFYRDVKEGLIEKIEEAYVLRAREFARADKLLYTTLEQGIEDRFRVPDLDNLDEVGDDTPEVGVEEVSRASMLEYRDRMDDEPINRFIDL